MTRDHYHQLESMIASWAERRSDIRSVIVVGSRARTGFPADELADLDLVLFTQDVELYRPQPPTFAAIAPVWLAVSSQVHPSHAEWLVLFAGGRKVDFYFAPIAEAASLAETLDRMPFQGVLARGWRILLDKNSRISGRGGDDLSAAGIPQDIANTESGARLPTFERFLAEADSTLLSAARAVKFIRRKDLWRAKFQVDTDLKRRLLTFIEWQAQVATSGTADTWYDGRFMAGWAAPAALNALPQTFGAYEAGDLLRALQATMALFDQLALDIASPLAYPYPQANQDAVMAWLTEQIELTRSEMSQGRG